MYENEILLVEKLLESYPVEWRRNYYNNKKTLKINKIDELDSILDTVQGTYDEEKNLITLYSDTAIIHELFHSCFRDGEKLNKQIKEKSSYCYCNGIAMKNKTTNIKFGVALTEGFVEYVSRKISGSKGCEFEYFIVDLLISIYGEDILKYPFTNDVSEFYEDERFYKIVELMIATDLCYIYWEYIKSNLKLANKIIETKIETKDIDDKLNKIMIDIKKMMKKFYIQIIECIKIIIQEYKKSKYQMIEKNDFILKIKQFLVNPDYQVIATLLSFDKYDLNKEVQKILKKI